MVRGYFRIALRNLWKNLGLSAINIIGLAVGISTCLLIMLYVLDELSYDSYNEKADRIFRVDNEVKFGDNQFDGAVSPAILGPAFSKDFPEMENYVRFRDRSGFLVKKGSENLKEDKVVYADSSLFEVFTLPMIAGNPITALREPRSLVVTENIAKKYFGSLDIIGRSMLINDSVQYKITGVIKDIPRQSHFNFDFFAALCGLQESREDNWFSENFQTYLLVKPGTDINRLQKRLNASMRAYSAPQLKAIVNLAMDDFEKGGGYVRCSLMPLNKIHLYSNKIAELGANGSIQYVYIFSAIALFILAIACVNFMNLSTAHSANRAKEVGVRKVLGSFRNNLIAQFLTESMIICFISFLIAIGIAFLLMPFFNQLSGKSISLGLLLGPKILLSILILIVIVGLLAGSYPAFFLSSFQPIEVLKGKLSRGLKGSLLRNVLVVFQFSISIILIVGTIVIYNQLSFIRHKDIGFSKEQVLAISNTDAVRSQSSALRNELLQIDGIRNVTFSGFLPVNGDRNNDALFTDLNLDIKKAISMQMWKVDENYLPTLQIHLKEGRNFAREFLTDSTAMIINEAAEKFLGPQGVVNKKLYELDDVKTKKVITYHIIGVIRNFNFNSLREQVTPLALILKPDFGSMAICVNSKNIATVLSRVKEKWTAIVPGQPMQYSFLDDDFNKQYLSEERIGKISVSFSILAIFIACLGLFGLVTYAAEQRIREIGIRKVLGANFPNIITLLSKDFIKLVLLAILIATPMAYWAMHQWLQDFAYRIDISWWIFVLADLAGLLIALCTVAYHAIKAALANPATSLRTE